MNDVEPTPEAERPDDDFGPDEEYDPREAAEGREEPDCE